MLMIMTGESGHYTHGERVNVSWKMQGVIMAESCVVGFDLNDNLTSAECPGGNRQRCERDMEINVTYNKTSFRAERLFENIYEPYTNYWLPMCGNIATHAACNSRQENSGHRQNTTHGTYAYLVGR